MQTGFLDGRKVPIGYETNQQVKVISPGATVLCEVISKKDTAQDWTMRLSWNR